MKDFTVKVPGVDFDLSSNQIYYIREVSDNDAPDGYQKVGIRKHPLPGIAEGIIVPYDERTRTWNTGFFSGSKCYSFESKEKAADILGTLKNVLLPELQVLVEGDLENGKSSNNQFFDEFVPFNGEGYGEDTSKYKIKGGNVFNTRNPLEFLALWWALIGKQVMPKTGKNSASYKNCSYVIENKKQSSTVEQDKEFAKLSATSKVFEIATKGDKKELKHLQNVLEYVGLPVNVLDLDVKPLTNIFSKWCEKGGYLNENAVEFNEVFKKFEDDDAKEELVVYIKLVGDIKDGKVKVERRDIIIDGQNLGSDKKSAARKITADKELHKTFLEI